MTSLKDGDLRRRALERQIDNLGAAITRARGAILSANIMSFIIVTVLFNAVFGWNRGQLDRRAKLAHLGYEVSKVFGEPPKQASAPVPTEPDNQAGPVQALGPGSPAAPSEAPPVEVTRALLSAHASYAHALRTALGDPLLADDKWIGKVFDESNDGDLSYLRYLDPQTLRLATETELIEHIKREKQFDVVSLPVVGVAFSATDLGLLGGLALSITGFWLLGSLRKQQQTLARFVTPDPFGVFALTQEFTYEESQYALQSIVNAPVFSGSRTVVGAIISYWLFFFPPTSALLTFLYFVINFFHWTVTGIGYLRLVLVSAVVVITIALWFNSWLVDRNTETALTHWARGVAIFKESAERHLNHGEGNRA